MNYTLSRILGWIADNKLSTFLGICLFAFVISTIALASQKSNLQNELEDCQAALGGQTPATEPSGGETTEPTETETEAPGGGGEEGKPTKTEGKSIPLNSRTPFRFRRNVGV